MYQSSSVVSSCTSESTIKNSEASVEKLIKTFNYSSLEGSLNTTDDLSNRSKPLQSDLCKLSYEDTRSLPAEQTKTVFSQPTHKNTAKATQLTTTLMPASIEPNLIKNACFSDEISNFIPLLELTKDNITKVIDEHIAYIKEKTQAVGAKQRDEELERRKAELARKRQQARYDCIRIIRNQIDILNELEDI